MKGVILVGGYGTRLEPLTYISNKHLLPIYNKPMVEYGLNALRDARIRDVCVVLGGEKADQVMKYLGDGFRYGLTLSYVWQGEPKGVAHAISCAKNFVGDEKFVVYLADNIFETGIVDLVKNFEASDCDVYLLLKEVEHPERYGVVEFKDGKIVNLEEKPMHPKSKWIITGVYGFKPIIFKIIDELRPSWRGEYEITEGIAKAVTMGLNVKHDFLKGRWFDAGTFDDILEASLFMKEKMRGR
jgi:glucose-1-phosphate thymidylyltransferase